MAMFRRYIVVPFDQGEDDKAIRRLIKLNDSLCLRRTREIIKLPDLNEIPPRILDLSKEERDRYENTKATLQRKIRQRVGDHEQTSKFGIFQMQLQLRILCNHGTFQKHFSWMKSVLEAKEAMLSKDVKQDLEITKSIIFSCWTRTLNLVAKHLKDAGIPFSRIDGECPLSKRQKILDDFKKTTGNPILVMTTGTGAFGLNLTCANRVFIVELQWNPSVESQAIARAIRLGQERNVSVIRYIMNGTVEQEMQAQQKRKLKMAQKGVAAKAEPQLRAGNHVLQPDNVTRGFVDGDVMVIE
ncbi:alcohol dehydrogenase [Pestalotiopsis sp. IQ-011]